MVMANSVAGENQKVYDAIVIGGGFFGSVISLYLARTKGLKNISLIEQSGSLLSRASAKNQARVHHGYHYPRNFNTAYRSKINYPRFELDWSFAVSHHHQKLYGIPRSGSNISAQFFVGFAERLGAELVSAPAHIKKSFNNSIIKDVYVATEAVFDASLLSDYLYGEISKSHVELMLNNKVTEMHRAKNQPFIDLIVKDTNLKSRNLRAKKIFNCTYSNLNTLSGDFTGVRVGLKHEICEMALMKLPEELAGYGVTIMDGPFFSIMPYPSRKAHTLSHVRYTPHTSWQDRKDISPYERLDGYSQETRHQLMVRDVCRYIPSMLHAKYLDSIFEVKTVLTRNEMDDGRPILFEESLDVPNCYSVLGGKLDNVYDVLDKIGELNFT